MSVLIPGSEVFEELRDIPHVVIDLNKTGDNKTIWDADDEVSVSIARHAYEEARKKGRLVYRTDKKGEQAGVMSEFDPQAERMIIGGAIRGG